MYSEENIPKKKPGNNMSKLMNNRPITHKMYK